MKYEFLIGETLFLINSTKEISWRPEEESFIYRDGPYRQSIHVSFHFVSQLPQLMVCERICFNGMRVGTDADGNEVRRYEAAFLPERPVYAISVLNDSEITVYFLDRIQLWNNPNIRIWNMLYMEKLLLRVDALVLHCCYLDNHGKALLFSAPSGTGKTTQAKLWEKLGSAQIINGDKAIIQKRKDGWYACGYPFHGSAEECLNEDRMIEAVVVVRQNSTDMIEKMTMLSRIKSIYSEATNNSWDHIAVEETLNLIEQFCSDVEIICQKCTMNDEAYYTLHRYLEDQ